MAVRAIITKLSADWIIRGLDERDYGIDLQMEYFAKNNPTGAFVFGQVKGTKIEFDPDASVKVSLDVSFLEYALLFTVPFILFRVSVSTGEIRFLWLQQYVKIKLRGQETWRSQQKITVELPVGNVLPDNEAKLVQFASAPSEDAQGLAFLMDFHLLENGIQAARSLQASAGDCATAAYAIGQRLSFVASQLVNDKLMPALGRYRAFEHILDRWALYDVSAADRVTEADEAVLAEVMAMLASARDQFLLKPAMHEGYEALRLTSY